MKHKPDTQAIWLLLLANLLLPAAVFTFAVGFFPHKPFIAGINTSVATPAHGERASPFEKVIFMVVDALRSDFVYAEKSGFSFVQELIRSGAAIPFTAHATPPTITMPRVKAMTTGSIPSFLDVILNFAESDTTSTLATQDSWPLQFGLQQKGKLIFYGDDTWLKLFPGLFSRADGTTSFFVSDFTEVDNNVSRHIDTEMMNADWNGMILHYLGLDHIGHKSGPDSPNMLPKQHEMDGVVQQMYRVISSSHHLKSTLLVLCGDHGMNDAGNHGGSAPGETSPALVFISPKFKGIASGRDCPPPQLEHEYQYYAVVEQSDLVPTLAGLLGFPIPLNNVGVFIPELLGFWEPAQRLALLRSNADQIVDILRHAYGATIFEEEPAEWSCREPQSNSERLRCKWFAVRSSLRGEEPSISSRTILEFLYLAQTVMSTAASSYDTVKLESGIALGAVSALCALLSLLFRGNLKFLLRTFIPRGFWRTLLMTSYAVIMFASSYVEEEQQYWYWLSSAWLAWLFLTRYNHRDHTTALQAATVLGLARVIRRWNQTGQKLAGSPDIAKSILSSRPLLLWAAVIGTYLYYGTRLCLHDVSRKSRLLTLLVLAAAVLSLVFKIAFTYADAPELVPMTPFMATIVTISDTTSLVNQARLAFISVLACFVGGFMSLTKRPETYYKQQALWYFVDLASLTLITQTRAKNIPLIMLFACELELLGSLNLSPDELAITWVIFQHVAFFAYGGSNAISSVDLSNAYNGVSGYNVMAVGILTFVSNWAGPIWWSINLFSRLLDSQSEIWTRFSKTFGVLSAFTSVSILAIMVACTLLRAHLFIWTVFSPKYLFVVAWCLGQHVLVNGALGLSMVWLHTRLVRRTV